MGSLLVQMALYGLAAAAAAPIALVLSALILAQSKRPVSSVWVFTAGAAFLDAAIIAIVLVVFGASAIGSGGDASAILDVILGALFLLLGVSAIFAKESPEKDAKQRERAMRIASAPLPRMFVMGILVQVINIDAMAVLGVGIKEIVVADVSSAQAAIALLVGLMLMLVVYYGPVVVYQLSPTRALPMLRGMSEWIMGHARPLEIVTGGGLGVIFLWKGLAVLA
jgi:hypothetical protein